MNNTIIITGGNINILFAKKYIKENSFKNIIAVDKGLEFLDSINIMPNYVVGDFDTVKPDILNKYTNNENIEIHKFNPEKDYTDTDIAIKLAISIQSEDIVIIGRNWN